MICPTCRGSGHVMRDSLPVVGVMPGDPTRPPAGASIWQPCPNPDCHGGQVHCCQGDTACNEQPAPAGETGRR